MADPAISDVWQAVTDRVEAIVPTISPQMRFQRRSDEVPATTRNSRTFDMAFGGHGRDLSNEGQGVQNLGLADRIAQIVLAITYPESRGELDGELVLAVDSELVLRALGRSADWTGTPVRRAVARSTTDRSKAEGGGGTIDLVVTVDVQYRDSE